MLIQDTISIKRRSTKSQEFRLTIGNNFGMLMYVNNYVVTYSFNWKIGRYDNPFHPKLSKIQTYQYLTQQLHYKNVLYTHNNYQSLQKYPFVKCYINLNKNQLSRYLSTNLLKRSVCSQFMLILILIETDYLDDIIFIMFECF